MTTALLSAMLARSKRTKSLTESQPPDELPLVSIVTPTYNQADYLAETIESVLASTYPRLEFIVLDDGSTDRTPDILAPYAGRVRWRRHENVGQATTLNRGWMASKGKYVGYLSSDDLLSPDCISMLVQVLERDPGVVCAFPDFDLIDPSGRTVKRGVGRPFSLEEIVVGQSSQIGPGALFRKEAFDRIGGWRTDLKLGPDREFWIRLASQGRFHFVPRSMAGYRIHPQSLTVKETSEEVTREFLRVLDLYYAGDPSPECLRRKDEAYAMAILMLARNAWRSGRWRAGLAFYREACRRHPPLAGARTRMQLLRTVVSKPLRLARHRLAMSFGDR